MAAEPDGSLSVEMADLFLKFFSYITSTSPTDSYIKIVIVFLLLAILALIAVVFIFKSLGAAAEQLAEVFEAAKKSGLFSKSSDERKILFRKQRQFCSVLDADLAYIAKAENWNDQYFTDLEAEVEAEGQYYSSILNRLLGKKIDGLRRVASLVKAIDTSSEKLVLLVGEPGSGKSVALRHLAKKMAERGKSSKSLEELIPLYLNLRELECGPGKVTVDDIKKFVLENIRRGDADTSAYVKENWTANKEAGRWFFLFDSFDEIPAVLHAPTGSAAVREYSDAIRQFLDSMGDCRGVLASREYKGPTAIPWHKFRILPLNKTLQHTLVRNSFLNSRQVAMVNLHLAAERSSLGNNPLFLTLLCRFVKDEGHVPKNDHVLLTSHINRLAYREPEYTFKKFGLSPEELINGAEEIAIAFAKDYRLGLAPKVDEIHEAMQANGLASDRLDRLISALVDVKIGRNDVPTARPGDRRFAFSHRRYQESLFANYLATNPSFITPESLLVDREWREYAVTLLQTQDFGVIEPIINFATNLLQMDDHLRFQNICREIAVPRIGYFSWADKAQTNVLEILQEGMKRRLADVPDSLRDAVAHYLVPRWSNGDHVDRFMAIKLGGLLPQKTLIDLLESELEFGVGEASALAFRQCAFLTQSSEELNTAIRKKVAQRALSASDKLAQLRLEALAAQLPPTIEAGYVISRCNTLRPIFSALSLVGIAFTAPAMMFSKLFRIVGFSSTHTERIDRVFNVKRYNGGVEWCFGLLVPLLFLLLKYVLPVVASLTMSLEKLNETGLWKFLNGDTFNVILIFDLVVFAVLIYCYLIRYSGHGVGLHFLVRSLKDRRYRIHDLYMLAPLPIAITILLAAPFICGRIIYFFVELFNLNFKFKSVYIELGVPTFALAVMLAGLIIGAWQYRNRRTAIHELNSLLQQGLTDVEIFLHPKAKNGLGIWMESGDDFMKNDSAQIRFISAITLSVMRHPKLVLANRERTELDYDEVMTWPIMCAIGTRTLSLAA